MKWWKLRYFLNELGTKLGRKAGTRVKKFLDEHGNTPYGWGAGFTWLWVYAQLVYQDWMESWGEANGFVDFMLTEFIFDFGFEAFIHAFVAGFYAMIWPFYWFMEISKWLS